jgi:perosamine synthetase
MIPVNEPVLTGNEKKYLAECIETGWISSEGPFVRKLEAGLAELTDRRHGIAVCNGSVALDVALAALRIGPGDEVILPAFTIVSCCAAIVRAGATPVVVDADPATWNMDVARVADAITPRTKAIMAVHIYGLPVDMDPLLALARAHGLKVIEDAAEVIGQTYRGRPCGGFGDVSTVSFYPNKHVTAGEGGMVLVDDEELAARCRSLRNLFFDKERRFVHEEMGWNFRLSNLQAAVGVAQLERLGETVTKKRQIGAWYDELLRGTPGLRLPVARTDYAENICWVYGVVLEDAVPFDAREAIRRMREGGVDCRHFFWPMNRQPVFERMGLFAGVSCPVAENLAARGFYLPSGVALTRAQAETASSVLRQLVA